MASSRLVRLGTRVSVSNDVMIHCKCGFTCGVASAFEKHLKRFEDAPAGEHVKVDAPESPKAARASKPEARLELPDIGELSPKTEPHAATTTNAERSRRSVQLPDRPSSAGDARDFGASRKRMSSFGSSTSLGRTPGGSSPTYRLMLVRHAESANRAKQEGVAASKDPELSELGFEQAEVLGGDLEHHFGRAKRCGSWPLIMSSPMRRCLLTIQPMLDKLGVPEARCFCHGQLFEFGCCGTDFRGTPCQDIEADFPHYSFEGFRRDGLWDYRGCEVKESVKELKERVDRVAEWLQSAELSARVVAGQDSEESVDEGIIPTLVLVTHQSFQDMLVQVLVHGTSDRWEYGSPQYKLENAGVTEIYMSDWGQPQLGARNYGSRNRPNRRKSSSY